MKSLLTILTGPMLPRSLIYDGENRPIAVIREAEAALGVESAQ